MLLSREQIQELMDKAKKGPWEIKTSMGKDEAWCDWHRVGPFDLMGGEMTDNCRFLAALPDIAETALSALARVEELEQIVARHKELGIGENV